jgi:hypothetical protein
VTHTYIKSARQSLLRSASEASAAGRLRPNALVLIEPINCRMVNSEMAFAEMTTKTSTDEASFPPKEPHGCFAKFILKRMAIADLCSTR